MEILFIIIGIVISFCGGMLLQQKRIVNGLIEAWIERSTLGINAFGNKWIEVEVKSFRNEGK